MKKPGFTAAGGWIAMAGALVHLTLTSIARAEVWQRIVAEGWWSTVSMRPDAEQLPIAEAFWITPGSFAVPLFVVGLLAVTAAREGRGMPRIVGWIFIVWGVFCTSLLPVSGAPLFAVVGALFLAGASGKERAQAFAADGIRASA